MGYSDLAENGVANLQELIAKGLKDTGVPTTEKGSFTLNCGQVATKRFDYFNDRSTAIDLFICSDKPSVCRLISPQAVSVDVKGQTQIRFELRAPLTPCKMTVTLAVLLKSGATQWEPFELIDLNLNFE